MNAILLASLLLAAWDAGTPGEIFTYGFGAQTFGLGRAYTAADGTAESIYYNPAAITWAHRGEFLGSYNSPNWLHSYGGVGFLYPTGPKTAFGFALVALKPQGISGYDENGNYTQWIQPQFLGGLISFARKFGNRTSLGLNGKFYYGQIGSYVGSGAGLDLGLLVRWNPAFQTGVALLNVVPPSPKFTAEREPFPRVFRVGFQFKPYHRVRFLGDLVKSTARSLHYHLGVELKPIDFFRIRFGYDYMDLSAGIGLKIQRSGQEFLINYTFSNTHHSATLYPFSHRISATIRFGGYRVWVHADPNKISLTTMSPSLLTYIYPHVKTKAPVDHWVLEIYRKSGELTRRLKGIGTPPLRLAWDGRDETGRLVPRGRYLYKLKVWDESGDLYEASGYLLDVSETTIF